MRIALVGLGRISHHHARAILNTTGLQLIGAADILEVKREAFQAIFNVPVYPNFVDLIDDHLPDIVVIATPSGMHFHHAKCILSMGVSVILEKPPALKPSQLLELREIASKTSSRVLPLFQNRYNKAVQFVKDSLSSNSLGDIRNIAVRVRWCRTDSYYQLSPWRGTFSMDGGCLSNQGIHHLDLLRFLCGDISSLASIHATLGSNIEVEDSAVAIVKMESGALATIDISTAARPTDYEASISLSCSKGLAQLGGIAVNELQVYSPDMNQCKLHSEDFDSCVYGNGHMVFYSKLIDLYYSPPSEYDSYFFDLFKSVQFLNSLYLSDETKSWVTPSSSLESSRLGRPDATLQSLYTYTA